MARIFIIGAGLTGLSTAYHLEKSGFYDYTIIEKESVPGGLTRTFRQDGFTFDITGHLLHVSDEYFKQFIIDVIGADTLATIERKSFIYMFEKYHTYPFQSNLAQLPPAVITECIEGFVNRATSIRNPKSFQDWVLKHFGAGIGKHFFFPYNGKLLCHPLTKVTPDWTGRFVPSTTLNDIIEGLIKPPERSNDGYNATFSYPRKGGISVFADSMSNLLKNKVHMNKVVDQIDSISKKIIYSDGSTESYETLISTMPLKTLIPQITFGSKTNLSSVPSKLLNTSVWTFNIGINRSEVSDKHWIYYPEKNIPFYRLGFWNNFSQNMTPPGCSALYGEVGTFHGKSLNSSKSSIIKKTCAYFDIKPHEIMIQTDMFVEHAYVIYDAWRAKNLPKIHQTLNDLSIYSVGRFGSWKYSSMQEAILDGKAMAEVILATKDKTQTTIIPASKYHPFEKRKPVFEQEKQSQ